MYEMGLQENWKKSVCQILSSKKNIIKIKGCFRLTNPEHYCNFNSNETLKDKLIKCFVNCEDFESDLKGLSAKYLQLFANQDHIDPHDRDKVKVLFDKIQILETNISKCLNRYDTFQKTSEKIIYKLSGSQSGRYQEG